MISGLSYFEEFLTPESESELISIIDEALWLDDLKRRVQHYGFKYDYKARSVDESMYLGELPDWAKQIGNELVQRDWFPSVPDQLIVNEYLPGQGISAHVDCVPCFQDSIASITLGSGCMMDFTSIETQEKRSIYLRPGSIVILSGESRYDWKHAIAARKSDPINGQRILRRRRISLTFRNVLLNMTS